MGSVVDQIASCCAIAFRAPLSRVSPGEIADAQAQFRGLCGEYSGLIDEVAAGICRLPTNTLPNAGPSGIDVLSKRER
ncbi:hypothetical protein ACIBEK_06500 [Nocardia fusca]|uniref:hypothetical protein n=1 Tax=Nocardia fusca TaxID=941183 RepID=UPI0037B239EC